MTNEELKSGNVKPDSSMIATQLAVERTVMAADRSLMAWVRTGLSLISFGFTIYKFLEYSREQAEAAGGVVESISSPKVTGLILIGMGILSLILGTVEYIQTVNVLKIKHNVLRTRYSLIMSALVTLLGIIIFLGIIFRLRGIS